MFCHIVVVNYCQEQYVEVNQIVELEGSGSQVVVENHEAQQC